MVPYAGPEFAAGFTPSLLEPNSEPPPASSVDIPAEDLALTDVDAVLGWMQDVTRWLKQFSSGATFDTALPFTGTTVGGALDLSKLWVDKVYVQLTHIDLAVQAPAASITSGNLAAAAHFSLSIGRGK